MSRVRGPAGARAAVALGALVLVAGTAGPALADGPGRGPRSGEHLHTLATADADLPGSRRTGISSTLRTGDGPGVDLTNRAEAYSSCDGCRSVALAVQVAIVSDVGHRVRADNHAEAMNIRCRHCSSIALAYQFVVVSPGRLELRPATRARIEVIIGRMRALARTNLSNARLRAQENQLAAQLSALLRHGVVKVPGHPLPSRAPVRAAAAPAVADHEGQQGSACGGGSSCR